MKGIPSTDPLLSQGQGRGGEPFLRQNGLGNPLDILLSPAPVGQGGGEVEWCLPDWVELYQGFLLL